MATIDFIPDKLNTRPVVWRGFTVEELGLTALAGLAIGFVLAFFYHAVHQLDCVSHADDPDAHTDSLGEWWLADEIQAQQTRPLSLATGFSATRTFTEPGEHGSLATGSYRFITLSRAWELKRTRRKGLI
ncbi:conjugative transfer region protein [Salmonella enterica subsp. enterica serovar Daytona]|uniref:Conjugative transfer region protein n=1 Tax=Salmonella enterica subsp. enterica serovar Daytona TaxID=1962639 RepID=A0A447JCG0_SALET|nr:conjugative transfer region protein [Salmonella enterica subsp. enterica serovar Daytona]